MGLLDQVLGGVTGSRPGPGMSPLTKALLALLAAKAASSYLGRSDDTPAPSGGSKAPAPSGKIESGILAGLPSLGSLFGRSDESTARTSGGHEPGSAPSGKIESGILAGLPNLGSLFGRSDEIAAPAGGVKAPGPAPSGKVESGMLAGIPNLDSLLGRFQASGHEDTAKSWIGAGPNKRIEAKDLEVALGPDTIAHLEKASGLPRDQLLRQLSETLPQVVDKLTPDGRLPTEAERSRW